ncbi:MAG TPA: hypothetical protein EYN89_09395 [Flavobacteriales bacterium]|nr:hypothetical protein [Flavobacteriales bacterium]
MKLFVSLLIFYCIVFSRCNSDQTSWGIVSQNLNTNTPSGSMIRIENLGEESAHFSLKINDVLFSNNEELKEYLVDKTDTLESLEKRSWRFVKDHVYFDQSLTDSNWIHDPGLFINSLGFGYCDDKAAVLAFVWEKIGLFSRVWNLGGHVVPEVYANDGWSLYDPMYEVYYQTNRNYVNGVKELSKQPSIVRSGYLDKMPCKNIHALWNRYSYKTAKAYLTIDNNMISEWYSKPVAEHDLKIKIPPKGTFEFPGKYEKSLVNSKGDSVFSYANAKLTIPKGWTGKINIPLVIHSINGKGLLNISGKEYEIDMEPLKALINKRTEFIYDMQFKQTDDTVEIIYLVNPLVFGLSKENLLVAEGYNTKLLDFRIVKLNQSKRINFPPKYDFPEEAFNVANYMDQLFNLRKLKIKKRSDIYKKLILIITANNTLKQEEMEDRYRFFYKKIDNILSSVNSETKSVEFVKSLNDDIYFSVFISLVEHLETEEIVAIINDGRNPINHNKTHTGGI